MTRLPFLDTNVILRHVLSDEPNHSPRASALFERLESGDTTIRTTDTVIFETVYTLQSFYKLSRATIRDAIQPLIAFPGIKLPGKSAYEVAFNLYDERPGLSFADCCHVAFMKRLRLNEIISFDQKIGRVPGITRVEPA